MASDTAINSDWGGGKSPFGISYGKLMMWYFLLSDTFTFAALLISYGTIRVSAAEWADPNVVFSAFPGGFTLLNQPLVFVTLMTFILILSSVFVVLAVIEGHRENKKGVAKWLFAGIIGGVAFLACQAWEWTHLIDGASHAHGMTINMIDFGPGHENYPLSFAQLFFLITGFHGFHVFSGVCLNIWALVKTMDGTFGRRKNHYEMIEKVGLYWHFVDLVWVFVFLAFYLL